LKRSENLLLTRRVKKIRIIKRSKKASSKGDKMETSKELFKLSVSVRGVKKRCRKSDHHILQGGYMPYNGGNFDQAKIEDVVRGIVETNMKQVDGKIYIHLDHIKQGDFMQIWEPFSNKNVRFELKTSLENALQ